MADPEPPELWWSSTHGATISRGWRDRPFVAVTSTGLIDLQALPADAILLVPAEPVDEKGRTPTYLRGFEDGRMAGCAGAGPVPAPLAAYARAAADHRAAERAENADA